MLKHFRHFANAVTTVKTENYGIDDKNIGDFSFVLKFGRGLDVVNLGGKLIHV